ncbi:MAG: aspartate kinase [Flavobacteriia bacterium]|nr:aspartate kinase [Flavobacteriia bacterium]
MRTFLNEEIQALRQKFKAPLSAHLGFEYDQVVSLGEILSSKILAAFLEQEGLTTAWLDARKLVRTDAHFKEANIDWGTTENLIRSSLSEMPTVPCFVTQGFIGHTVEGDTTTLGREGSDYSAAIFAYALEAKDVTIWKDVPGMLNADPKYFQNTQLLSSISYREAIELSYFGASVIHPKTVKPLQNKGIPLHIKSFISPHEDGTIIQQAHQFDHLIPSFIVKKNQLLITISANDFSFINEDALAKIFERFYQNAIKINLMQNSALNFSTLVDSEKVDIEYLIEMFKPEFNCKYNENVELLTIRHYNAPILDELLRDKTVLLEQRSRQTARFVYRT